MCHICTVVCKECVIQPCGHAGICITCANKIKESTKCCPFCKKMIFLHLLVDDSLCARLCINLNNLGVTVSDLIHL